MVNIVGVHGIGQSGTSQSRLTGEWSRAINRGLSALGRPDVPSLALELPYWTSILARGADRLGPGEDPFDAAVPLSDEEAEFIAGALEEVVRQEDLAVVQDLHLQTLGPPKLWPARLTRLVMAYDRRFPRGGGKLFVSTMREVRFYLYEPGLASQVRDLVAGSFSESTSGVIGHSLGSVIGYDVLRRGQIPSGQSGIRTFVTCGSPLGIPTVRRGLGIADSEPLALPGDIEWVNVFDPGDFITGGRGLNEGPQIADVEVDNGIGDPHSALRYLRTTPVARAIAAEPR